MSIIVDHLLGRYIDKLLSLVEDCIKNFNDCPSELELMKENVERIQDLLKTVEKHHMKTLDHHTNVLRELMYIVEDIIADYSGMKITNRLGIGKKLKNINEKLKEMYIKLENSVNAIVASGLKSKDVVERRQTLPINDVTGIVGLGDVVSKIKEWVTKEDKERRMKYNCIGLVGKGGSGKTTLAQMILKDEEINQHFQLLQQQSEDKRSKHSIKKMMFVTVSQPVDVKMMMKSMLKQLEVQTTNDDDEGEMSTKIHDHLKGSRYFVILDDVWSLDASWWERIKNALPEGNENCILVTSRMRKIVRDMGVVDERIYEPKALGEQDGWTLFCKNILTDDVSKYTEMKEIGMEIVRKCGGLPLAIKVMAGVVSSCDISTSEWKRIRDKFMEHISNNQNDSVVMGSLGLSYEELRLTYLQPCLLCFGVFPEDLVIHRDTMIRWWIGEGFVPLTEDDRSSVESAEKCFDELVSRSLVEVVHRYFNGKVLSCKLHDLVREMLIQKGKSEAFFEIGKDKISRRILLDKDDINIANNQISASKNKVRAVVKCGRGHLEVIDKICEVCKYVRVIDLPDLYLEDYVPNVLSTIEKLKHLTCLCIPALPTSFSNLKSLLVLRLYARYGELPSSIIELDQLICLDVSACCSYMPKGLGNISTLQVLKGFEPSPTTEEGYCRFEELRKLTQLVTLEMTINSDNQLSDGELDALSELHCLRHLTIGQRSHRCNKLLAKKLDKLVPPKNLDDVNLISYPGEETPSWLCTEDLPYLRYLYFDGKEQFLHLNFDGGKHLVHFNEKFHEGKKWGITHLRLNHSLVSREWKVIHERMPYLTLKTIHSAEGFVHNNRPPVEFDENGVWWGSKIDSMKYECCTFFGSMVM